LASQVDSADVAAALRLLVLRAMMGIVTWWVLFLAALAFAGGKDDE
jgi:hypothetical protein